MRLISHAIIRSENPIYFNLDVVPSCRSRWPGIIHQVLHTPSPPTPCSQKTSSDDARMSKIKCPTVENFSNIKESRSSRSPFVVPYPPAAGTDGGCTARSLRSPTDKKKSAQWHRVCQSVVLALDANEWWRERRENSARCTHAVLTTGSEPGGRTHFALHHVLR